MHCLLSGNRHRQGPWIGEPDVLGSQYHQPARDEQRVLARLQHPGQPIERTVRGRTAHRLDKRRYRVVMTVAGLVVQRGAPLQRVGNSVNGHAARAVRPRFGGQGSHFQGIQGDAGVAVGNVDQVMHGVRFQDRFQHPQTAPVVVQRASHNGPNISGRKRFQRKNPAAGQQGSVYFKGWIFGRGPDEYDSTVLHVGQNHVLLRLVETMNLIHEQDRRLLIKRPPLLRTGHRLAQVGYASRNRRNRLKVRPRHRGNQARERGFTGTGRTPK